MQATLEPTPGAAGVSFGDFAGKYTFASTGEPTTAYLTAWRSGYNQPWYAGMAASSVTETERCLLYVQQDGTLRLQLGNQLWLGLNAALGWLTLVPDFADAVPLQLGGSPFGSTWQVQTSATTWAEVSYASTPTSPLLTINGGDATFAPDQVTPSLAAIRAAGGCPQGDLGGVSLVGEDLGGALDFTGTNLAGADLTNAVLDGANLAGGNLQGATLVGVSCNGSTLDNANLGGATLTGTRWGTPASARGIALVGCQAAGAVLGGQALDASGANLSQGNFTGADLSKLQLAGAQASGAVFVNAVLDGAVLDQANLQSCVAVGASCVGTSMQVVNAQGANFAHARLDNAKLNEARMGAKAYLFTLAGSFAAELNSDAYVQQDLVAAFAANGYTLAASDQVTVLTTGASWQVQDPHGPYQLTMNNGGIDVFLASSLRPAILRGSSGLGINASGASLSGADMRGVAWYAAPATLDHADLGGACLAGSLLAGCDFTQAYLYGTDLSGCVLVGAIFDGCLIGPGLEQQAFSLEGSQLQGAAFTNSTLLGTLMIDAAVALPQGVPLLTLPLADQAQLTTAGIGQLAPAFAAAGCPLGAHPTVGNTTTWLLDNSACTDKSMPQAYLVSLASGQLNVADASSGSHLFFMSTTFEPLLDAQTASTTLVAAFTSQSQQTYQLAAAAPITATRFWAIEVDATAAMPAIYYPTLRVYAGPQQLTVYGSVIVKLAEYAGQYPAGLAFAGTQLASASLDPTCIGPAGLPYAWVQQGSLSLTQFLTTSQPR